MYVVTARAHRKLSRTLQRAEQAEGPFLEAQRTEALAASVAEIVHDFRNSLAVVSGFSELAGSATADGDLDAELTDTNTAVTPIGNVRGHLCGRHSRARHRRTGGRLGRRQQLRGP